MYTRKEQIRIVVVSILIVVVLAAGIGFMVATIGNSPEQQSSGSETQITADTGSDNAESAGEADTETAAAVQMPAGLGETRAADANDPAVKAAEEIIAQLDEEEYVTLRSRAVYELKDTLTKEKIDAAKAEISEDWGERTNIGRSYVTELASGGETWQIVETAVSYENAVVTYRITFNGTGKFAGLYMR